MVLLGDEEENLLLLLRDEQQIGSPLKEVKVKVLIGGIEKIDAHSREVFGAFWVTWPVFWKLPSRVDQPRVTGQ